MEENEIEGNEFMESVAIAILRAKDAFYNYLEENGYDPNVAIEIKAKTVSWDGTYVLEIMSYDNIGEYKEQNGGRTDE